MNVAPKEDAKSMSLPYPKRRLKAIMKLTNLALLIKLVSPNSVDIPRSLCYSFAIMARTLSAKKRVRQSIKRHKRNLRIKSMIKRYKKKMEESLKQNDLESAKKIYSILIPIIDRASTKGVIHPNKAARHKSVLSKKLAATESKEQKVG